MILPQSKLPLTSKLTRSLKPCAFAAFLMCVRGIASVHDFRLDRRIFDSGRVFEFDYYKIFKLQISWKRKLKQRRWSIPPISTKWTISSHQLNLLSTKNNMTLEIKYLSLDRHNMWRRHVLLLQLRYKTKVFI
jgi:hypothetical protein